MACSQQTTFVRFLTFKAWVKGSVPGSPHRLNGEAHGARLTGVF